MMHFIENYKGKAIWSEILGSAFNNNFNNIRSFKICSTL